MLFCKKVKNHPNRPPVAISVSRADRLLRLGTELVGAGHHYDYLASLEAFKFKDACLCIVSRPNT